MKKSTLLKLLPLSIIFTFQTAHAKDLWELYQSAQHNNGNWAGQQYDYLANQKNEALAKGDLFPQVGLQGSVKHDTFYPKADNTPDISTTTSQVGIGLRQALFRADKWATYEKAQIASQLNELQLLQQRQQFTEQIIKAYLGVLQAEAMTESLNAEYTALKAQDEMMQAKLQQGVVARVDTEEARARLASVQASRYNNEVAIMNAKQQLGLLTGQNIEKLDKLKMPFNYDLVSPNSIDDWLAQAQNNSIELQLAQVQLALAQKQEDLLKSNLYPKVDLVGNVAWTDYNNKLPTRQSGTDYSIGVEVDFPLFTGGRTKTALEQGSLQTQASLSRLTFAQQNALNQATQAYLNILSQRATIVAQQSAVNANAKVAEASSTGYSLGMRSMVDNLLAQRQYYSAKRELITAYFNYLNAYVDLQKVTGNLNEKTVQVIDNRLQ